jgi:hypothetical protein
MLELTCTQDNIMDGFVDVGMLDNKHKLWPDFYQILKTKRKKITSDEIKLIERNFEKLYRITMEQGHVPESIYDFLGFPKDEANGNVYERQHGIEAEWMQRAKELTHPFQQQLRRERERTMQVEFDEKIKKEREAIEKYLKNNKAAEEKLLQSIDENNLKSLEQPDNYEVINERCVDNASLLMFSKCMKPHLEAFVRVRISTTKHLSQHVLKKYNLSKFPNLGKFEEALNCIHNNGRHNLISLAYTLRKNKVILM